VSRYCNVYGAETPDGHARPYGGLVDATVMQSWTCDQPYTHRFKWVCEFGHEGEPFGLCEWHEAEMMGRPSARGPNGFVMPIPPNVKRDVQTCYRCASQAPACDDPDHQAFTRGRSGSAGRCGCKEKKVRVRLVSVS